MSFALLMCISAFVPCSIAHDTYGTVLAEQLNQYCAAHCQSTSQVNTTARVGKAGPRGQRGVSGPAGPMGRPGVSGPQGPIGATGQAGPMGVVNYTAIEEMIQSQIKEAFVMTRRGCHDISQGFENVLNETGGVFEVNSKDLGRTELFCDLSTDGGKWTVFQRRMDGTESFQRSWEDYVSGFGRKEREFWLGLEKIHQLTAKGRYELRVDIGDWEGNTAFAKYSKFSVGAASTNYQLNVGGYSGNAGDSLALHNRMSFSTTSNCAVLHKGGWWFENCDHSNLNGIYHKGGKYTGDENRVEWTHWKNTGKYLMKFAEMKFRPIN